MLADLGAETIKVEPPAGDPMRSFSPVDPDCMSPFYCLLNRGKTVRPSFSRTDRTLQRKFIEYVIPYYNHFI
jgi:hypothetical protein